MFVVDVPLAVLVEEEVSLEVDVVVRVVRVLELVVSVVDLVVLVEVWDDKEVSV